MNTLTLEQRYNLVCIADVRLDHLRSVGELIAAAKLLQRFVLFGTDTLPVLEPGEAFRPDPPLPVTEEHGVDLSDIATGSEAVDMIPDLPSAPPAEPQDVDPRIEQALQDAEREAENGRLLLAVLGQLQDAINGALPCPRNADLGEPLGLTAAAASQLVCELRDTGRIEIESRGSKRRVSIDGRWTLWTGETPTAPQVAAPAVESAAATDLLGNAVSYLQSRGYSVVKIAGDWMINDRDTTPDELIQKAEQVRARSENAKAV